MKKVYQFTIFCIMLAVSFFIDHGTQTQAAVRLNQTNATICIGGKTTLEVSGASKPVKWSTSNKNVAKVGSAGVVTGIGKGTATITAKAGSVICKCRVTVNETYGASVSNVVIKRETPVMLTFTKDAVVSYKIQDLCVSVCG